MTNTYICCWSTFFVDELIIYQDTTLHHLETLDFLSNGSFVSRFQAACKTYLLHPYYLIVSNPKSKTN